MASGKKANTWHFGIAAQGGQVFHGFAVVDAGHVLLDDGTFVQIGSDVVRGGADQLHAAIVRLVVRLGALEAGQEAVVDVDGAAGQLAAQIVGEDLHVAGQHHQFGAFGFDDLELARLGLGLVVLRDRNVVEGHVVAGGELGADALREQIGALAERFALRWQLHQAEQPMRTVIFVSQQGHCLNDLLFRWKSGLLRLDIRAIVSNHRDFYQLAAGYNVPFHHIPVTAATKAQAEARQLDIIEQEGAELVVLARYMQILSDGMCQQLAGRAINIHHSFLPSFKGAKPYYQAHERGVKLIGATAHYVTADLDEGPIIEQDVARVDHAMTVEDLTAIGRDTESQVLARAVKWHSEHRVLLNGQRTVVFR